MNYKIAFLLLGVFFYFLLSLLIFRGEFSPVHYYSYDNMQESKEKGTFISNDLKMNIEGDSLRQIKNLKKKFYSCKSMYEKFYGFLIHTKNEDKEYRRIVWEESTTEFAGLRNWIVTHKDKYVGSAFYYGTCDAKIGDTLTLIIRNKKTYIKIGEIKIFVE